MNKLTLLTICLISLGTTIFAQITTDQQASEKLQWLIDNHQTDSVFTEKSVEILKWYATSNPELEMRVKGLGKYLHSKRDESLDKRVIMIYTLSEFENQTNLSITRLESAVLAIKNVLIIYGNYKQFDDKCENRVLEKYSHYSKEELTSKIKKL